MSDRQEIEVEQEPTPNAPSEPTMLRAYVNERGVSVAHGATALDAVREADPADADAVTAGTRRITDSRGLPIDAGTPVHGGAIFRVLPVRAAPGDADVTPETAVTDEATA